MSEHYQNIIDTLERILQAKEEELQRLRPQELGRVVFYRMQIGRRQPHHRFGCPPETVWTDALPMPFPERETLEQFAVALLRLPGVCAIQILKVDDKLREIL
jgi:hypothetical protein